MRSSLYETDSRKEKRVHKDTGPKRVNELVIWLGSRTISAVRVLPQPSNRVSLGLTISTGQRMPRQTMIIDHEAWRQLRLESVDIGICLTHIRTGDNLTDILSQPGLSSISS